MGSGKNNSNLALGFYQKSSTALAVLKKLRAAGFRKSAYITHLHEGGYALNPSIGLESVLPFFYGIDKKLTERAKKWVVRDETLVIVSCSSRNALNAMAILRDVETGHPISFLIRSDLKTPIDQLDEIKKDPLPIEELIKHAAEFAASLAPAVIEKTSTQPLLDNLKRSEEVILNIRRTMAEAEQVEQTISVSAEWLLDNAHVIQGTIEDIQRNLPRKYYNELPKLTEGRYKGLPRIYAVAKDLVSSNANRLNKENIETYLESFQSKVPLTLGELWALPLMLKLRLIECAHGLALHIERRLLEGEKAGFWGNRLRHCAKREPDQINAFVDNLAESNPSPSPHFAESLADHLFDEETVLPLVNQWLKKTLTKSIQEIIHEEQLQEAIEEISLSNAVISLISLSQLSWRDLFEKVSLVDKKLSADPSQNYSKMDFLTRDSYRHSIESIARNSDKEELLVANHIVEKAGKGVDAVTRHVGYYLIDAGRPVIEKELGCMPTWRQRFRRFIKKHDGPIYLGLITCIIAIAGLFAVYCIATTENFLVAKVLLALSGLFLISEVTVQFINLIFNHILPPHMLPRMSFKEGIPEEYKTLIVIPMKLTTIATIDELAHRLEVYYLANNDKSLQFALFDDFEDADEQHVPGDEELLKHISKVITDLDARYGPHVFFLFHRNRVWSPSEKAWIGWERKRGKLYYLNRYLTGEPLPENILKVGKAESLQNVRYVITLDADTQLPRDKARELIETAAHVLNVPRIDKEGNLERGYSIIQPRVSTEFTPGTTSKFNQLFSDMVGIDPYTQSVSDIYQDLTAEGTFHGKGLYDVKAFHSILKDRYPEEHLLSHDLIEGAYARAGFASDVILYDQAPQDYLAWSKRHHRWMRGDWQIADWLFFNVPDATKIKKKNSLSAINRWKIFDNLRRSLMPVAFMVWFSAAWLLSDRPLWDTAIGLIAFFIPLTAQIITNGIHLNLNTQSIRDLFREFKRQLVQLAFLPHQACLSLDAALRVFWRRNISHLHLLEWDGFRSQSSARAHAWFLIRLLWVTLFAALLGYSIYNWNVKALSAALPILLLWFFSPLIAFYLDKQRGAKSSADLSHEDLTFIRQVARKTWNYFDTFVGPQSNWLPPDNYQAALRIEVAQRTSPTNIGLWLLSVVSAYDFRYISIDDALNRIQATFTTLGQLEKYDGHFLNWFDIQSLKPLYPRYVSTVDSGNFIASIWALQQAIEEMVSAPLLPLNLLQGLHDSAPYLPQLAKKPQTTLELIHILDELSAQEVEDSPIRRELANWQELISRYYPWVALLSNLPGQVHELGEIAKRTARELLNTSPSLESIASGKLKDAFSPFIELMQQNPSLSTETQEWLNHLEGELQKGRWYAGEKMAQALHILENIDTISEAINMSFLYNPERKLFSIGFHVDDCKMDSSHYDLLASECRISSLVAIAKGEVPIEHWWALGRPYGVVDDRFVLLSWGGTMFEYLMPLLFNRQTPQSLLGQACWNAVAVQKAYGSKLGIPWGVSEAAFSELDAHRTYQYRSFGVPGLGLKRGLEEDLVISPYSSMLALAIDPKGAIENLHALNRGKEKMLAEYGYYESIDYTRQKGPHGERGVIIYAFMAHHQGMSLLAMDNLVHDYCMAERFKKDPRIKGIVSLIYEKIPTDPRIAIKSSRKDIPISRLTPFSAIPIMGIEDSPDSPTPKINLLGNGEMSLMITNTGGGYTRWRDFDITRWRSDITRDNWGTFCYVKDMDSGLLWSTTYHPTCSKGGIYTSSFKAEKVDIRRRDNQIDIETEFFVSPEDTVEIRMMTIANLSAGKRRLELTSYSELCLAPHAADRSHPAFNKLFIETEYLPDWNCLIAFRRPRSSDEKPIFVGQMIVSPHALMGQEFETDRDKFIGRGKTLYRPGAVDQKLTNTQGTVLDPIFSLRLQLTLEHSQRVQLSLITLVAETREELLKLIIKYSEKGAVQRTSELVWTHAQLELRHLRIHQEEVQLFLKLAGRILYPHAQLRPSLDRLKKNKLGQSRLWPYGISGDLPIIVVSVADSHELDLARQIVTAHAFWRLRGLKTDLVFINEETSGYDNPLNEQLRRMISSNPYHSELNKSGGIYLLTSDQLPEEDLILLLSAARINLVAARGSLRQQVVTPQLHTTYPPRLFISKKGQEYPSQPLPFIELPYFNGTGGYTQDGREYVIYLGPGTVTPMPWVNVIANPQFGTIISESNSGMTWYGNSQSNRITSWSNDPILDPISEGIYIRDDQIGTFWSPTPSPIRELDAYRISHGQGYTRFEHNSHGIEQHLLVFVPNDDNGGVPVKIQKLTLTNRSPIKRKLSLYFYADLTLGTNREETQQHIITDWDKDQKILFAYNRYNPDFGSRVAYTTLTPQPISFTGNRTEFLGRNNGFASPSALKRETLSGNFGAALDPCAALQVKVEIEPDQTIEIVHFLGYAENTIEAKKQIEKCREPGWVDATFTTTKNWWDKTLGTITLDSPDLGLNLAFNRWLLYQNLSCRFWGRSGFYQSSGAYGFRDQLQDAMALVYAQPALTRAQILRAAARQFPEGDVQHWWHPPHGGGVRTRITDDLLWLPLVTAHYINVTKDASILQENLPFLKGEPLKEDQHEAYFVPEISTEQATLLEHCKRAIAKGTTHGPNGIPLIGGGDWNDGMNRVGLQGRGESVWLGWFLITVLQEFSPFVDQETAAQYQADAAKIKEALEAHAWDGKWYRRAYFDNGTPLGSTSNHEDVIDSLPQSWGVISGAADPARARQSMEAVEEHLVVPDPGLVLLLTPPFDKTPLDPGYIKGYPPGVRENGGQYTHGSLWVPMAHARLGDGDKAARLLHMMHPGSHTVDTGSVWRYKTEPYVLSGDVYSLPGQVGRGGWSWYSGAAGWMYRIWLEEMLGFKLRGDQLTLKPALPQIWDYVNFSYRYRETPYEFVIENPEHISTGKLSITVDNVKIDGPTITLVNDGHVHKVRGVLRR